MSSQIGSLEIGGVFVALLTPFGDDGEVDVRALTDLVEGLVAVGVNGLVALGTTGEFADLTDDERRLVIDAVAAAARGRVPVVVGVGSLGTAQACSYAEQAQRAGADAVLSLPPLFWKLDDAALFAHFAAVAAATSLPVLLYDIPVFAGRSLSPELVRRVAVELPSVIGVKLTVSDFRSVAEVLAAVKPVRPDFSITVGFEDLALSVMLAGGDGVISGMANFCAPTLLQMIAAVRGGDLLGAVAAHQQLMRLFPVYFQSNPPILALKMLAHELGVRVNPTVRTPIHEDPGVVARIDTWVDSFQEGALS